MRKTQKMVFFFGGRAEGKTIFKGKDEFYAKNKNYLLSRIRCGIFFHSIIFSKEAIFSEKTAKNRFWGPRQFLKGIGRLLTKMNMTFFIENVILNLFSLTIFSKKLIFSEETWKTHFLE